MKLVYLKNALRHLEKIHANISAENPRAAKAVIVRIQKRLDLLADAPNQGRPGVRSGTREVLVGGTPYIVTYRLRTGEVQILTIRDGRRRS